MTFYRKEYGIIVTESEESKRKIQNKIKEIDSEEFEYYLPKNLIWVNSDFKEKMFDNNDGKIVWVGELAYVHKFTDIDIDDLCESLTKDGVPCFWIQGYESNCCTFAREITPKQYKHIYSCGLLNKHEILTSLNLEFLTSNKDIHTLGGKNNDEL